MGLLEANPIFLLIVALVICVFFYFGIEKMRRGKSLDADMFDIRKDLKNIKGAGPRQLGEAPKEILLGTDPNGRKISVPIDTHHMYCSGTTGTGKTVLLSNIIKASIDYGCPLAGIDGKGDTGPGSMVEIIRGMKGDKKMYVIDMNNPETSDKYNPFKNTSPTVVKDMLINLTEWSEEHYKANTERYLQCLIELMFKLEIPLSLESIVRSMPVDDFLVLSKRANQEGVITKQDHVRNMEVSKTSGKIAQDAMARFSTLIEGEMGALFAPDGVDIITALRENAIILFVLNPLLYPELSPKIGNLAVIDSKKAVSHLYKQKQGRVFYLFDEINVYCSNAFLDLVNKSRSADVTCFLASQTLSDLDAFSVHFRNQIIENCNSYVVLRQNTTENAEGWAKIIGTRPTMDVTYQLKMEDSTTTDTGMGSARKTREFYFHPDYIKSLPKGKGVYINKDTGYKSAINVNKPF